MVNQCELRNKQQENFKHYTSLVNKTLSGVVFAAGILAKNMRQIPVGQLLH